MTDVTEGLRREIPARIERLKAVLRASGIDGALLLHAVDLLYHSGTRQNGALWVPASGEAALLVRKSFQRARAESPLAGVRPFPPGRELSSLLSRCPRIGVCFDVTRVSQLDWWRKHLPGHEFVDISAQLRGLRSRKSPAELEQMRLGGRKLAAVIGEIPSFLRAGMRELDIAAEIEVRLRRAGNEGSPRLRSPNLELFTGLVVSGEAGAETGAFDGPVVGRGLSAAQPVGPSERVIRTGDAVLVDYTALFGGYLLDMARVFVVGTLEAELTRAIEVSLAIQEEIVPRLVPGEVPAELYDLAADRAEAAGLAPYFMGVGDDASRFVGHGIGMELDEFPVLAPGFDEPLEEGQVVALEPKFVFPGRGAVGVENTWAVTRAGGEKLTPLADGLVRVPT
ncbi:MAG TPA: Xaa-Pro peptidase family protein [Anaeromyxobacteraceae bacterium]|nr:Xaa-Pro peptidase family protein [Anaeromyxobacteraceae bacterium]